MNTKFLLSSDNNNRNELLKKKIIHYYIANGDATIADLGREMDLSIRPSPNWSPSFRTTAISWTSESRKPTEDANRTSMASIRHPDISWESIC